MLEPGTMYLDKALRTAIEDYNVAIYDALYITQAVTRGGLPASDER